MNPQGPRDGSAPGADVAASAIDSSVAPEMVAAHGLRRYALHDEIASGRIATVYLGRLLGPHGFARTVAIKRVRSQFMRDAELAAMLFEGARLAGRVRHPNVIATLDVVSGDDLLVVMEYVHGESLATLLRTLRGRGVLAPLPIASGLLVGVLRGLHAVHDARRADGEGAQGDSSPASLASLASSVLVGTDGLPRLFDLGVGRASAWAGSSRVADLFAASALLWEVLAGRPLLPRLAPEGFEPPSRYRPDLSPAIDAVVARGLDPSPATRFASAAEMADALEAEVRAAPAFEIGAWVTSLAMPALAERARLLATIESVPAPARAIAETLPPTDGARDTPVAPPVDPKEAVTRRTRSVPPPSAFDPPISDLRDDATLHLRDAAAAAARSIAGRGARGDRCSHGACARGAPAPVQRAPCTCKRRGRDGRSAAAAGRAVGRGGSPARRDARGRDGAAGRSAFSSGTRPGHSCGPCRAPARVEGDPPSSGGDPQRRLVRPTSLRRRRRRSRHRRGGCPGGRAGAA